MINLIWIFFSCARSLPRVVEIIVNEKRMMIKINKQCSSISISSSQNNKLMMMAGDGGGRCLGEWAIDKVLKIPTHCKSVAVVVDNSEWDYEDESIISLSPIAFFNLSRCGIAMNVKNTKKKPIIRRRRKYLCFLIN